MTTRERILAAAITLFNEQGTAAVSTNHIAEAAGVSPGNLYYHFRNKEAIIRAIFEHLIEVWQSAAEMPSDRKPELADVVRIVNTNFTVLWQYRFYYRELPALARRDALLGEQYRNMREQGLHNLEAILRSFAELGVLNLPNEPMAIAELARACWILADFWLPFVELGGVEPGPEQVRQGENLVLRILKPYMAGGSWAELRGLDDTPLGAEHNNRREIIE